MPLLQKNARGRPDRRGELLGQLPLQRVIEQVRRVEERRGLIRDRAGEPGVRVAERRDADAREQVQVLAALGVPQAHALAADQRDRLAPIGLQHVARLAPHNVVDGGWHVVGRG